MTEPAAEEERDRQDQEEGRNDQQRIGHPHDDVVDPAAVVAGHRAEDDPDGHRR